MVFPNQISFKTIGRMSYYFYVQHCKETKTKPISILDYSLCRLGHEFIKSYLEEHKDCGIGDELDFDHDCKIIEDE